MHLPPSFREDRLPELHALIRERPLGTLVVNGPAGLEATPLPFLLDAEAGPRGVLRAHLARANPMLAALERADECLVIFRGIDGYITPNWYPSKHETGKAVPTWNYAAVQAWGKPRLIADAGWLRRHLDAMTNHHEGARPAPWAVADAPADYVATQIAAISGIEIEIARFEGKWKMSQNRAPADREGVIAGLRDPADAHGSAALADLVEARGRAR